MIQNSNKQTFTPQFDSIFEDVYVKPRLSIWEPFEDHNILNPVDTLYQGRLQMRNHLTNKWLLVHIELFSDKLVRPIDENGNYEFIKLNCCIFKKLKNPVNSKPKFGFKLQRDEHTIEFLADTQEQLNRWFEILKRLTILPRFANKHKLLQRIRNIETPYSNYIYYQAYKFQNGMQYQVRIVEKSSISDAQRYILLKVQINSLNIINQEIKILRQLASPNIQKLLEVYEDEVNIYMLFESFFGRDIRHKIFEYSNLNEKNLAEVIYKLIVALNHMHTKDICHRDLKLENIILKSETLNDICIINFTQAEQYNEGIPAKKFGTIGFMAPELFKQNSNYTTSIDMYSIGVIFYIMTVGKSPFDSKDLKEVEKKNESSDINWKILDGKMKISESGMNLLHQLLEKNSSDRISAFNALSHQWFINTHVKELNRTGLQQMIRNSNCSLFQQSLNTIVEKSEKELSVQDSNGRIIEKIRGKSTDSINYRYEMDTESVYQKLFYLNSSSLKFIPSRQRRIQF